MKTSQTRSISSVETPDSCDNMAGKRNGKTVNREREGEGEGESALGTGKGEGKMGIALTMVVGAVTSLGSTSGSALFSAPSTPLAGS